MIKGKIVRKYEGLQFSGIGFHGDLHLTDLVDNLLESCELFVETGTYTGDTLNYVSQKYPDKVCMSCEPDKKTFGVAKKNVNQNSNVKLYNLTSQEFMKNILGNDILKKQNTLFWLDAHGYGYDWPLKEEISFFSNNSKGSFLLIDDFKVPGKESIFNYDLYEDQECSYDYIKDSILTEHRLFYPNYSQKSSSFHPLVGWGLLTFNEGLSWEIPDKLTEFIKEEQQT